MVIVEPVPPKNWASLADAASHACRTSDIGRKLHGFMSQAGFSDIDVQAIPRPDTEERLLPMIENMAGYARGSGKMSAGDTSKILSTVERAISEGSYLALTSQFVVTATC